ncbi:uncharacterized protein LOC142317943 [Lycorma delicatula]|uniref:uncharacterized protein LOC142317943 n=1 Tax=Lycorma delicatula TaxID=130591 RepID=UPI003F50FACD
MAGVKFCFVVPCLCCSVRRFVSVFVILCVILDFKGCEGGILFYDTGLEGDDEGAWGSSVPFLGTKFAQQLMGPRVVREWESAEVQVKWKNNKDADDGFKMGNKVFSVKEGNLQLAWNDGDSMSSSALHERWWPDWQLPVLLAVFALVGGLGLSLVILVWLKNQMSSSSPSNEKEDLPGGDPNSGHSEGGQWIYHPVIRPMTTETLPTAPAQSGCRGILPEVMTAKIGEGEEKRQEPIRIKAKGLLERRGSSASLTIDLLHPSQENLSVTPTRECTAEEYLLSVGNVLSRKQLRACLRDVRALHREFWDLPLNHPEKLVVPGSGSKNRYRTIIPNEATRVCLPQNSAADCLTGYINANYIRGYDGEEKAFIATQGPLPHTVIDFWIMIWQEHAPVIVMFTKLWEKSHSKCEPYFPSELNASVSHGEITVTVKSVQVKDGYTVRQFDVKKGEEIRHTIHFWYDSWPDHKTPANAHSLLCLAKEVEIARCLGHAQKQNSPSVWSKGNESPITIQNECKSQFLSPHSREISPNHESDISPPSLKEVSPVLNFGHLEFKEDIDTETEASQRCKDSSSELNSPIKDCNLISLINEKSMKEDVLVRMDSSYPDRVDNEYQKIEIGDKESDSLHESRQSENSKIVVPSQQHQQVEKTDVLRQNAVGIRQYSRFIDAYTHYNGKKRYKFGSLPHDCPVYPDLDLDSVRSKSVETPPTWIEPSKDFNLSSVQKDKFEDIPTNVFNFENLSISQISGESNEDKPKVSERCGHPECLEELKQSFSPRCKLQSGNSNSRAARLSVDSPGYTGDSRGSQTSPFFNETIPWLQSRSWMWSSDKGDASPASASYLSSPNWFEQGGVPPPREGSLTGLLWADVPRGVSSGPVVVHCSAGIGRTGCFIAICIGINQLLGENNVDILGIVCRMRYDRGGMVQTAEQYEFIHRALALFERSLPDQSGE